MLTIEQTQAFDRDGFVLVPDVFTPQEIEILLSNVTKEGRVTKHQWTTTDASQTRQQAGAVGRHQ